MADIDPSISLFAETVGKASHGERLKGRKILVVGGGQRDQTDEDKSIGNGRAMSVLFAREGATVVVLDYNKRAAEDTVAHIKSEGGNAMPYEFDVRDAAGIPKAVDDAKSMLGGLDGMAIVVGTSRRIPLVETDAQAWDEDFAINVRSHFLFSKHGVEVMSPGSSIVIISSMSALRALDNNPVYEAAKAALLGLTRAVARAGEEKAIRCNAICMVSPFPSPRCLCNATQAFRLCIISLSTKPCFGTTRFPGNMSNRVYRDTSRPPWVAHLGRRSRLEPVSLRLEDRPRGK